MRNEKINSQHAFKYMQFGAELNVGDSGTIIVRELDCQYFLKR